MSLSNKSEFAYCMLYLKIKGGNNNGLRTWKWIRVTCRTIYPLNYRRCCLLLLVRHPKERYADEKTIKADT